MSKRFLIILRRAPYGRLDAAEAVRHLSGAAANGLDATALLLADGVYLAKVGQTASAGWTTLSTVLAQLATQTAAGTRGHLAVYAFGRDVDARGLRQADLVPGCQLAGEATIAELLTAASATLVY
ncbi:MAG: DsrE family protein [Chloroflexi bacterium]|nr:DsrE family protein [Chloroflexota bacterium]